MRRSSPSGVYDSRRTAADGVMTWLRMFAAVYIRSTGVVSGVIGRFIEDCLHLMRTLWIGVSLIEPILRH